MAVIYISSTYEDLKKEREAAYKAVHRLGHQTIAMEEYVACDERPVNKCLADVRKCAAYIGIFAWRYGFIPPGFDKSITHLEYQAAREAGIPCLIFLLDKKAPWPVEKVSEGEDRDKINALRDNIQKEHTVSFFKNPAELSVLVSAALNNLAQTFMDKPGKLFEIKEPLFALAETGKVIVNLRKKKILQLGRLDESAEGFVNDIYFHFYNVSRRHCQLLFKESPARIYILDLGSSFGTFVNERRVRQGDEVGLKNHDLIRLGRIISFEFLSLDGFFLLRNVTRSEKRNLITWLSVEQSADNVLPPVDVEIFLLHGCSELPIPGTDIHFSINEKTGDVLSNRSLHINIDKVII